jgi:hypothetical protein
MKRSVFLQMRRIRFLLFTISLAAVCAADAASFSAAPRRATNHRGNLSDLPLWFEQNRGQADSRFEFISRAPGYSLMIGPTELLLGVQNQAEQRQDAIRVEFVNANPEAKLSGRDELQAKVHYYRGNDPEAWITGVSTFSKVQSENLYDGINAVFYGNQRQLEYDLILRPRANPSSIALRIDGAQAITIAEDGDLKLETTAGPIVMKRPLVYQEAGGARQTVNGGYVLLNDDTVAFELGEYDRSRALVIDPVLTYSTYLGGTGRDSVNHMIVDGEGNAYVTGQTFSPTFINNSGAGAGDLFVTRISASGTLLFSTVFGGRNLDTANGIAIDFLQNLYVVGSTSSTDFPIKNALRTNLRGPQDAFVLNLARDGTLGFSTYFGGSASDSASAVSVDSSGIYVAGETNSDDFPNTLNPQATVIGQDAFVVKMSVITALPAILFARTLGGGGNDSATDMAVDGTGNIFLTGSTDSSDFPRLLAFQSRLGGLTDAFLTRLNPTGTAVFSSYLGGSSIDRATSIDIDSTGVYVAGQTASNDFPVQRGAQETFGGVNDQFVTKVNLAGSAILWSTYVGGTRSDTATAITLDGAGNVLVAGYTESTDYPLINPLQDRLLGGIDVTLERFTAAGQMIFSSYFGGQRDDLANVIASDIANSVYVAGTTFSADFPTAQAIQLVRSGESDAFITKIPESSMRPVNDDFINAFTIAGSSGSTTGNNFGATLEPKEPPPPRIGRTSVWWRWTATFSGPIIFDTIGSPFDTMLGIFRGPELAALVLVAQDDDSGGSGTSRLTFQAVEGVEYRIVVTGFSSAMGPIKLNWSQNIPPFTSVVAVRGLPLPIRPGVPGIIPPATQQSVGVTLGAPYPVLITGQVLLLFTPDAGLVDDPAIQFSLGGRTVNFRIAPNTTDAVFDDLNTTILFQTGTVAGTITVRVVLSALGNDITPINPPQSSAAIAQQPPGITDFVLNRTSDTAFELVVQGYSTTRHMKQALFDFKPSAGSTLVTTSLTLDVESAFNTWYRGSQSPQFGGLFRLAIPFTVSGGTSTVFDTVFVTLTNTAGNSARIEARKP